MIGYDLDGTIATEHKVPKFLDRIGYKLLGDWWGWLKYLNVDLLSRPINDPVIITSRPESLRKLTTDWLNCHNIWPTRLVMYGGKDYSIDALVIFKANAIIHAGVKVYYENDEDIILGLRKLLPGTIQVLFAPERRKA